MEKRLLYRHDCGLRFQHLRPESPASVSSHKTEYTDQEHAATHWGDHNDWHQHNLRSLKRVHTLLGSLDNAPTSMRVNDHPANLNPLD